MNKFSWSISFLHQQALFSSAENLNESEMLFISSWNLLTTKWPSIFYLKKNSTKQEKKLTSPFALEGIFVYLYRDRVNITVPEHAGKHFICKWSWRLLNGCPLQLLWIWRWGWKLLWRNIATFSQPTKGWELKCIKDWSGFCGLKKVKCGDPQTAFR